MLQEGGRRQHDIGVVGGVGEELLVHHGEEVAAHQSPNHGVLVGSNGRGIRVVDEERLNRGPSVAMPRAP